MRQESPSCWQRRLCRWWDGSSPTGAGSAGSVALHRTWMAARKHVLRAPTASVAHVVSPPPRSAAVRSSADLSAAADSSGRSGSIAPMACSASRVGSESSMMPTHLRAHLERLRPRHATSAECRVIDGVTFLPSLGCNAVQLNAFRSKSHDARNRATIRGSETPH